MPRPLSEPVLDVRGHLDGFWIGYPGIDEADPMMVFPSFDRARQARGAAVWASTQLHLIFTRETPNTGA